MGTLSHADMFFIISSFGTIIFMVLVGIILYQVIKVLRIVRVILERIEAGSERLVEDLAYIRTSISQSSGIISRILGFFLPTRPRRGKKRTDKDD